MVADLLFIGNSRVTNGSISAVDNVTEQLLQIQANEASQNIDVFRTSGAGLKVVVDNTAGVAVRCFDNTPLFPLFVGGPNTAPSREGQCF